MPGVLRAPAFPFPLCAVESENAAREGQHTCNSSAVTWERVPTEGVGYGMSIERERSRAGVHAGPPAAAGGQLGGGEHALTSEARLPASNQTAVQGEVRGQGEGFTYRKLI